MNKSVLVEGFWDRLDQACLKDGRTKTQIANACNFDRKVLYRSAALHKVMMSSGYLARFCTETNTSADWLLGLRRERE